MQSRFAQSPIVAISSYIYSYSGYHRKYLQMSTPFSNFQRADILTKSIKKNLHMFIALLTYWHTHTHIYIYISHIQYILYHIQYYHISWQTFPSLQLELLPEGPLWALQEATVPLWQCEGWDDHLLAGGATLRDDFGGLENHGFPHQKSSLKALKPT